MNELQDKILCYYIPSKDEVIVTTLSKFKDEWNVAWLDSMVKMNPDTIFFFVTYSTDIDFDGFKSTVDRVYKKDLQALSPEGSPCEMCHEAMQEHEWADMDPQGFVVNCSNM